MVKYQKTFTVSESFDCWLSKTYDYLSSVNVCVWNRTYSKLTDYIDIYLQSQKWHPQEKLYFTFFLTLILKNICGFWKKMF